MGRIRLLVGVLLVAVALTGCHSGSDRAASTTATTTKGQTSYLCRDAAFCQQLLQHGGATPTEVGCLTKVVQRPELPVGKDHSFADAAKCVGSIQRLATIIDTASKWANSQTVTPAPGGSLTAWVRHMYEAGGATSAEATCLAARIPHAIYSKAEVLTPPTDPTTVACVGSRTRLRTITAATLLYLSTHPNDETGL